MKSFLLSLTAFVSTATLAAGADSPVPPCCPAEPAKPACCAEPKAPVATASCCAEIKPAAPLSSRSLYQLEAKWTDDAGRTVALAAWRGRPVVLAMIFANCEYACPVMVNDIQRLRATLPEAVREQIQVVLVTFDPVRDTPAALRAFRERMNLDDHWSLLTGPDPIVAELAMLLGVKYKKDARGQFAHSNLFTVLSPEGEISHQHAGLMGDVSPAAQILAKGAR